MNRYNLIASVRLWIVIPIMTMLACIAIIAIVRPVWGIDFVGGSLLEIEASAEDVTRTHDLLERDFALPSTVQPTQDGTILIRTSAIDNEQHDKIVQKLRDEGIMQGEERRFESIGPTIGQELRRKTIIAVSLVVVVMVAYLAYEFRKTRGLIAPWQFGIAAAWALIHDLLLVTALFVLFGKIWQVPIDTLFVTAQLAILGYSVNDTIVLFERLARERTAHRKDPLLTIINRSSGLVLARSLNTGFTALLTLTALAIFGGATIRWFVIALIAGIITGTYSSIFVAPPVLWWLNRKYAGKQ